MSKAEKRTFLEDVLVGGKPCVALFTTFFTMAFFYFEPNEAIEVERLLGELLTPLAVGFMWLFVILMLGVGPIPKLRQIIVSTISISVTFLILLGSIYLFGTWGLVAWLTLMSFICYAVESVYRRKVKVTTQGF